MAEYVSGLSQNLLDFTQFGIDEEQRIADFSSSLLSLSKSTGSHVFKTHDLPLQFVPLFLDRNPDFFVVNVVRDFRDVLVSRLMYNRYYLPAIGKPSECAFVEANSQLSDIDIVRQFFGTREMIQWLIQWKMFSGLVHHKRYLRFDYERLLTRPSLKCAVKSISQLLLPDELSDSRIDEITSSSEFNKIDINLHRDREQLEVKTAFCRKGVAGDYLEMLTHRQSEALKILMQ